MTPDRPVVHRNNRSKFLSGGSSKMHHTEVDDLPSTAASSVMHSPSGGPDLAPHGADHHLDEKLLGHALSDLYDIAEVVEHDAGEHSRRSQLLQQVEWYFSSENLSHDRYLRSRMDDHGWVALAELVEFAALRALEATVPDVAGALAPSAGAEISEDGKKVRATSAAVRAAFPPETTRTPSNVDDDVADEDLTIAASILSPRQDFLPEIDVADEDLTIAASLEPPSPGPRASKEGAPWPCMEWLTAEPCVDPPLLDWLLSEELSSDSQRRGRRHRAGRHHHHHYSDDDDVPFCASFDSEIASPPDESPSAAWARFSDDAYPAAAASLLWW